jgi:DNA-binding MltR family transcriptional regulator
MARDPAYVKAFKEFTKAEPTIDDLEHMEKEFYGESARTCGILHATVIEVSLEAAIKSIMRGDRSVTLDSEIFGFDGPLGTFAAKIKLAYAFGIFGPATHHDLELIRLMRNQFAHCRRPLQFGMPAVRSMCAHLQLPDIDHTIRIKTATTDETFDDRRDPRVRFIVCCHTINFGLLMYGHTSKAKWKSPLP